MTTVSDNTDPADVTNSQFLAELLRAAPRGTTVWVTSFIGNPNSEQASWSGKAYNPALHAAEVDGWGRQNTYFSVGAVGFVDGQRHRRKDNFERLLALVADDVDPDDLMATPTWGIETSPGKRQIGILLDTQDPDCANLELVSALVTQMADRGLIKADRSGNNAVRYVRLPIGQNQKPRDSGPFNHVVEYWNPAIRYTLEDAAGCFGVDLDEVRESLRNPSPLQSSTPTMFEGEQSDRLRILTANILRGENLHDSINLVAASMIASGAKGGAVVNLLRGLMDASLAPRDDRWLSRYNDIPRSVSTAEEKFKLPAPPVVQPVDPETGEILLDRPLFTQVSKLLTDIKPVQWLVENYLETDALSMVFGPSGGGKSFCVVDLACCVATGVDWHGNRTRKGAVFYIAGEGHNGLARRFAAWQKKRGIKLDDSVPLFKSNRAVQILESGSVADLVAEIERMRQESGHDPVMIVIDTLARNFGPGDENKQQDAGQFIENIDTHIRHRYKANVMVVHHTGHEMERARGSSAFKAAMDQEIWIRGNGGLIDLTVTKMKDSELPVDRHFRIEQIEVGQTKDGEPIFGAYLKLLDNPLEVKVGKRGDGRDIQAIEVLKLIEKGWQNVPAVMSEFGLKDRRIVTSIMKHLGDIGLAEKLGDANKSPWAITQHGLELLSKNGKELLDNYDSANSKPDSDN